MTHNEAKMLYQLSFDDGQRLDIEVSTEGLVIKPTEDFTIDHFLNAYAFITVNTLNLPEYEAQNIARIVSAYIQQISGHKNPLGGSISGMLSVQNPVTDYLPGSKHDRGLKLSKNPVDGIDVGLMQDAELGAVYLDLMHIYREYKDDVDREYQGILPLDI